jgi:hypothetical protein
MNKEYSIEFRDFMANRSLNGNSPAIKKYRTYMSKFTTLENNMYIFDFDKLRKYGFNIPISVEKFKFKEKNIDDYAFTCTQNGIDAFLEILNMICSIKKNKIYEV